MHHIEPVPAENGIAPRGYASWLGALFLFLVLTPLSNAPARPPAAPYDSIPGRPTVVRQPQPAALSPSDQKNPGYEWAAHSQGNIQLELNNHGEIGERHPYFGGPILDPISGDYIYGCTYPRGSKLVYVLSAAPMVGAIVGRDTLVTAYSFNPEIGSIGEFKFQSIDVNKRDIYSESAHSELDLICEYYDTITRGDLVFTAFCNYFHIPLELRVTQRSMAWSGADLDDFILFEYEVETMGSQTIDEVWIGVGYGFEIGHEYDLRDTSRWVPCRVGLLREYEIDEACGYLDHPNVAYMMTKDGYPTNGRFDERSPLGAVGFMFLGTSYPDVNVYFNWQAMYSVSNQLYWFMPQSDLGIGRPPIDASSCQYGGGFWGRQPWLYATMSRPEIDYDQITTAVNKTSLGWQPPPDNAAEIAAGTSPDAILSFGPFKLGPGLKIKYALALVAADNVHTDPNAFEDHFDPEHPEWYTNRWLDFSELAKNARWARKVYDNPGHDTDGDGNRGEYIICNGDTVWTVGDGVPDFRADVPPPAPLVKVIPTQGKLVIRWNGYYPENYIDPFSQVKDFEGYRVYVGRDERKSSLSLISSFDRENFVRYTHVELPSGEWEYVGRELPLTLDSLRIIYGDPDFDPLVYTRHDPLVFGGERYYFTMMDANLSDLDNPNEIHKVYPDAVNPGPDSNSWTEEEVTTEHGKPLPKFYEYEYSLDNLLPTVSYFVGVTAFDFGFAEGGIPSKESKVINSLVESYALTSADTAVAKELDVFVYPNPYRVDAGYTERGFENRYHDRIADRARLIHFANLPNVCTIRIFSLDGDLIRTIYHDYPKDDPAAMHDTWDLISRNVQAVETGLYYWTVESEKRTQIGKLVIIK